jgi:hypothetical protein
MISALGRSAAQLRASDINLYDRSVGTLFVPRSVWGGELGECAGMGSGTDQLSAGANTTSTTNSSVMS